MQMEAPQGYPKLASLQGTYPQLGIYRRFSILNARNLLYLQAELVELETELDECTKEDSKSGDPSKRLNNTNWYYLSRRKEGLPDSQWRTMLRLREKLDEYSMMSSSIRLWVISHLHRDRCLFQQRELAKFNQPEAGNLEFVNDWLADAKHGNLALGGLDRNIWKQGKDLLVVKPDGLVDDSFTRALRKPVTALCHKIRTRYGHPDDVESNIYVYDEKIVMRAADIVGTITASLLLVGAMVVLYCVREMLTRLGIVALFTVLFSLALMVTTKARRIEIFAATAA